MELPSSTTADEQLPTSFEWSDIFDFTIDDQLLLNLDVHDQQHQQQSPIVLPPPNVDSEQSQKPPTVSPPQTSSSDRVRKRDPRMVCENFLAGRVPCACPELDAQMMEEEEEAAPGKKRSKMGRTPGIAKCQVPDCQADIRELKGYHRRHRVCLVCANASSVLLHGETKRYCQQCGK